MDIEVTSNSPEPEAAPAAEETKARLADSIQVDGDKPDTTDLAEVDSDDADVDAKGDAEGQEPEEKPASKAEELAEQNAKLLKLLEEALLGKKEPVKEETKKEGPPDPSDYVNGRFDEDYLADREEYLLERTKQQNEALFADYLEKLQAQQKQAEFVAKEKEFAKANPLYEKAKAAALKDKVVAENAIIGEFFQESDVQLELVTYLGTHIKEAREIAELSPAQAKRALFRIEESLRNKPTASQAPKPISPINTKGKAVMSSDDVPLTDMDRYVAMRKKEGAKWAK